MSLLTLEYSEIHFEYIAYGKLALAPLIFKTAKQFIEKPNRLRMSNDFIVTTPT